MARLAGLPEAEHQGHIDRIATLPAFGIHDRDTAYFRCLPVLHPSLARNLVAEHLCGRLERRRHGVVPAVQEPEQRNHAEQVDDLIFGPVRAQAPGGLQLGGVALRALPQRPRARTARSMRWRWRRGFPLPARTGGGHAGEGLRQLRGVPWAEAMEVFSWQREESST